MMVLIPSIGESHYLPHLIEVLQAEKCVSSILVVNNSPEWIEFPMGKRGVGILHTPGTSIYDGWNIGIKQSGVFNERVAILNDDIVLVPRALDVIDASMDDQQEWGLVGLDYHCPPLDPMAPIRQVYGTFSVGGFGGFGFVLRPGMPQVHEGFKWWYGDDDLGKRVMSTGYKLGVHTGAPFSHPSEGTTSRHHPEALVHIPNDTRLFSELWAR